MKDLFVFIGAYQQLIVLKQLNNLCVSVVNIKI